MNTLLETNKYFTYIGTICICEHLIEVYLDDYGQCYVIAYKNEDGSIEEMSCGTYNIDVEDCCRTLFDKEYQKEKKKELWYCSGREYALKSKHCPKETGYAPECINCDHKCPINNPNDDLNNKELYPELFIFEEN